MDEAQLVRLFELLERKQTDEAWPLFLQVYSSRILQIANRFSTDGDEKSDCFLFVCEQLRQKDCRRLRRFDPSGSATFTTWLYAVVFNLCLDWRRIKHPRYRIFRSVSALSRFDQEVFHYRFERGMNLQGTVETLRYSFPQVTLSKVVDATARIEKQVSPRQRRFLQARRPRIDSLSAGPDEGQAMRDLPADEQVSNPEVAVDSQQLEAVLDVAVSELDPTEILILKLRYQHELSLAEIAVVTGLTNAQAVDRQVQKIVAVLRRKMASLIGGKSDEESV
jgi:RNA polymerase sigma factor (sigma-70 family)